MAKKQKPKRRIDGMSVRIPNDVHERLRTYCDVPPGLKILGVVAMAITSYLDIHESEAVGAGSRARK